MIVFNSVLVFNSFIDNSKNVTNYLDSQVNHKFSVKFPLHNIDKH